MEQTRLSEHLPSARQLLCMSGTYWFKQNTEPIPQATAFLAGLQGGFLSLSSFSVTFTFPLSVRINLQEPRSNL